MSRITLVIITHNRAEVVHRAVNRALDLPERPPVIVVDNASTDGTAAMLRAAFPEVQVIRSPANLGAESRNTGMLAATTPYVAFCDDDTWWEPGSLGLATVLLDRHARLALLTGRVLVEPGKREDPTCAAMAATPLPREPDIPGCPVLGFLAGATVARRSALLAAGGFAREFFLGGEERLLAVDLAASGWALRYLPELVAHHEPGTGRDAGARQRLLIRNELWFAWLRRPRIVAFRQTLRVMAAAILDREAREALLEALRGISWVRARRAVLPLHVEHGLRMITAPPP